MVVAEDAALCSRAKIVNPLWVAVSSILWVRATGVEMHTSKADEASFMEKKEKKVQTRGKFSDLYTQMETVVSH